LQGGEAVERQESKADKDSMATILIIILILLLIGALPTWPHSRNWSYGPTGLVGTVLLIVVILMLMRVI
jgi:hypothetical protein